MLIHFNGEIFIFKEDFIMCGFIRDWADLNGDGEVDDFEMLVEMDEMERMDRYMSGDDSDDDEEDELLSELEMAGLDYDDLYYMDEDERREALEEVGLDPDDYDF